MKKKIEILVGGAIFIFGMLAIGMIVLILKIVEGV